MDKGFKNPIVAGEDDDLLLKKEDEDEEVLAVNLALPLVFLVLVEEENRFKEGSSFLLL